jgi:hypothetical protein
MAFQKATCVPSGGVSNDRTSAWGFRDHREIVAVAALPDFGAFRFSGGKFPASVTGRRQIVVDSSRSEA